MQLSVKEFNLKHTLECGQFFRYSKQGEFYFVNSKDNLFKIKQEKNTLIFEGVSKKFITRLFRLDEDFSAVKLQLSKDMHTRKALQLYPGIRLIRQDPWECLVSYICSSASNIPRIQKNIESLSRCFGNMLSIDNHISYSFPEPGSMGSKSKINSCKLGFRCSYISSANKRVSRQFLDNLRNLEYEHARKQLMQLPGVGPKVADCVLLFSLGFGQAFPVDTWVRKAMLALYFNNKPTPNKQIQEFAKKRFGDYAGYAQQYLFYYMRNKKK